MPLFSLEDQIAYGPVISRRLGRSLGINILPVGRKVCSFDCIYCHYGATNEKTLAPQPEGFPTAQQVYGAVEASLRRYPFVDYLTFSGNGEPTLHPQFATIVSGVRRLRDQLSARVKLAIFSNATTLTRANVREALALFDCAMLKLDAGNAETLARINRPCPGISLEALLRGLRSVPDPTVQSVLIDGPVSNVRGQAYQAWLSAMASLRPACLQIYSTDYPVPHAGVKRVLGTQLRRIAADVEQQTGIPVCCY